MKRIVDDLFTNNPSYSKTALYPWDIIAPIGWDTFTRPATNIR